MHGLDGYGAIVPFSLLLPALAVIIALGSLTLGLRSVERELGTLRSSLRRSTATAVATNDLVRASDQLSERALKQLLAMRGQGCQVISLVNWSEQLLQRVPPETLWVSSARKTAWPQFAASGPD